jgi:hypothetical protein
MTDLHKKCDVCDGGYLYAGVASSGLGAMSCAFCSICLTMGAEMRFMVENTVESCGGIEGVHERAGLVYYDKEQDAYIDYRTKEIIPIKTKFDVEFKTKTEFEEWHKVWIKEK